MRTWLFRLGMTAVLLGALLAWVDGSELAATVQDLSLINIALIVGLLALTAVLEAIRWAALFGAITPERVRVLLRILTEGTFTGLFLPSTVGADLHRTVFVRRYFGSAAEAASNVLLTRILSVVGLAPLTVAGGLAVPAVRQQPVLLVLGGGLVLGCLALVALYLRPVGRALPTTDLKSVDRALSFINQLTQNLVTTDRRRVARSLAWSIVHQLSLGVLAYHCLRVAEPSFGLLSFLGVFPLIKIVTLLPISLGSWGTQEAAFMGLLALVGVDPEAALVGSLLYNGAKLLHALIGGLLLALRPGLANAEKPNPRENIKDTSTGCHAES